MTKDASVGKVKTTMSFLNGLGYLYSFYCFLQGQFDFGMLLTILSVGLSIYIFFKEKLDIRSMARTVQSYGSSRSPNTAIGTIYAIICTVGYFGLFIFSTARQVLYMEGNFQSFIDIGIVPVAYSIAMVFLKLIDPFNGNRYGKILMYSVLLSAVGFFVMSVFVQNAVQRSFFSFLLTIISGALISILMFIVPILAASLGNSVLSGNRNTTSGGKSRGI